MVLAKAVWRSEGRWSELACLARVAMELKGARQMGQGLEVPAEAEVGRETAEVAEAGREEVVEVAGWLTGVEVEWRLGGGWVGRSAMGRVVVVMRGERRLGADWAR